jgi:hypothetical protein
LQRLCNARVGDSEGSADNRPYVQLLWSEAAEVIRQVISRPFRFLFRRGWQVASKLPRSQQEKIAAALEAFVNRHSDRKA